MTVLRIGISILLSLVIWIGMVPSNLEAIAAPTSVTEVRIHLGTPDADLKFVPDRLSFAAGQRYKLILDNPSPQKHYFTAKDFADGIWTQKVEAGNVEIKGAIHELELRPGTEAAWFFTPLKSGTYELRCSIPGHAEAGMKGVLVIAD